MKKFTIKITGSPEDVTTGTQLIENIYGINNIHRMSGTIPCNRNRGEHVRFIELYSDKVNVDVHSHPGSKFFQRLLKARS